VVDYICQVPQAVCRGAGNASAAGGFLQQRLDHKQTSGLPCDQKKTWELKHPLAVTALDFDAPMYSFCLVLLSLCDDAATINANSCMLAEVGC